jgi:hypothetical protein
MPREKESQYVVVLSYSMLGMLYWVPGTGRHIFLEIGIFGFSIHFEMFLLLIKTKFGVPKLKITISNLQFWSGNTYCY